MKKFKYMFRSIMVNNVEKVIPNTVFTKIVIEMDESSVTKHTMELSTKDILFNWAWIFNFFLALLIVAPVTGLLTGGAYIAAGRSTSSSSWSSIKLAFIIAGVFIFIALWIFLSVRLSISNKKREHVISERGVGNWKIVDESKWGNFQRLLDIARNQREKEKMI